MLSIGLLFSVHICINIQLGFFLNLSACNRIVLLKFVKSNVAQVCYFYSTRRLSLFEHTQTYVVLCLVEISHVVLETSKMHFHSFVVISP